MDNFENFFESCFFFFGSKCIWFRINFFWIKEISFFEIFCGNRWNSIVRYLDNFEIRMLKLAKEE